MQNEDVIINLASTETYLIGQERLKKSLETYWKGDILFFSKEDQVGAPEHKTNPYFFKPCAFKKAIEKGYSRVVWVDASFIAAKNISLLFEELKQKKQMFFAINKHHPSDWINQNCLDYFKVTRESLKKDPMVMGGYIGLDFSDNKSIEFLNRWFDAAKAGAFIGSWEDHRHDQTCASIIVKDLEIKTLPEVKYCQYSKLTKQPPYFYVSLLDVYQER